MVIFVVRTTFLFFYVQTWLCSGPVFVLIHQGHSVTLSDVDVCEIIYVEQENTKTSLWVPGQLPDGKHSSLFLHMACREIHCVTMKGKFRKRLKGGCCHCRTAASLVLETNISWWARATADWHAISHWRWSGKEQGEAGSSRHLSSELGTVTYFIEKETELQTSWVTCPWSQDYWLEVPGFKQAFYLWNPSS